MSAKDSLALVGRTVGGHFLVEEVINESAFATLYRGKHTGTEESVAIRVLKLNVGTESAKVDAFVRKWRSEISNLAGVVLGDPQFVRTIEVGTAASPAQKFAPFMATEWLDGRALADDVVTRGPRSLEEALELVEPAAEALAHAHRSGVAHGSLSSRALFIAPGDDGITLRVLDMGTWPAIAEVAAELPESVRLFVSWWSAPEHVDRSLGDIGVATDVFGLAAVIVEIMRGKPLVAPGSSEEDIKRIVVGDGRLLTPKALGITLTPGAEQVIARALHRDPGERWPDIGVFWNAIGSALADDAAGVAPWTDENTTARRIFVPKDLPTDRGIESARTPTDTPTDPPLRTRGHTSNTPVDVRPPVKMGSETPTSLTSPDGIQLPPPLKALSEEVDSGLTPALGVPAYRPDEDDDTGQHDNSATAALPVADFDNKKTAALPVADFDNKKTAALPVADADNKKTAALPIAKGVAPVAPKKPEKPAPPAPAANRDGPISSKIVPPPPSSGTKVTDMAGAIVNRPEPEDLTPVKTTSSARQKAAPPTAAKKDRPSGPLSGRAPESSPDSIDISLDDDTDERAIFVPTPAPSAPVAPVFDVDPTPPDGRPPPMSEPKTPVAPGAPDDVLRAAEGSASWASKIAMPDPRKLAPLPGEPAPEPAGSGRATGIKVTVPAKPAHIVVDELPSVIVDEQVEAEARAVESSRSPPAVRASAAPIAMPPPPAPPTPVQAAPQVFEHEDGPIDNDRTLVRIQPDRPPERPPAPGGARSLPAPAPLRHYNKSARRARERRQVFLVGLVVFLAAIIAIILAVGLPRVLGR